MTSSSLRSVDTAKIHHILRFMGVKNFGNLYNEIRKEEQIYGPD